LKHFPDAELLTLPCSVEIGKRFFRTVHTSWSTVVGSPEMIITFHVRRNTNLRMFLRRIPLRIGYWFKRKGLSLNLAKACINVRVETSGQLFQDRYRVDEVCDLLEQVFGWQVERKMRI
jgi:hypothetical protein